MIGRVTRDQYIAATRALIREGERLAEQPSLVALRTWIAGSERMPNQKAKVSMNCCWMGCIPMTKDISSLPIN